MAFSRIYNLIKENKQGFAISKKAVWLTRSSISQMNRHFSLKLNIDGFNRVVFIIAIIYFDYNYRKLSNLVEYNDKLPISTKTILSHRFQFQQRYIPVDPRGNIFKFQYKNDVTKNDLFIVKQFALGRAMYIKFPNLKLGKDGKEIGYNDGHLEKAINVRSKSLKKTRGFKQDNHKINKELFLEQLDKAIDNNKLTFEIYVYKSIADNMDSEIDIDEIVLKLKEYVEKYIGGSKHKIKVITESKKLGSILKEMKKTKDSKRENLPGFEDRIDEISKRLNDVKTPTVSLIMIHNKEFYSKLDRTINVDPKDSIRNGFAQKGRLTQFITVESCLEQKLCEYIYYIKIYFETLI